MNTHTLTNGNIVLSYGRSGSILLAHNLSRLLHINPMYSCVPNNSMLEQPTVIHSHAFLKSSELEGFTIWFSLRKDPAETVLSWQMVNKFKLYHLFKEQPAPILNTMTFDLKEIKTWCVNFITWHNYYASFLSQENLVVIYEHMMQTLSAQSIPYAPMYPNKKEAISNYTEVVDYINQEWLDKMNESIQPFLNHKNSIDVYKTVDYAVFDNSKQN